MAISAVQKTRTTTGRATGIGKWRSTQSQPMVERSCWVITSPSSWMCVLFEAAAWCRADVVMAMLTLPPQSS